MSYIKEKKGIVLTKRFFRFPLQIPLELQKIYLKNLRKTLNFSPIENFKYIVWKIKIIIKSNLKTIIAELSVES